MVLLTSSKWDGGNTASLVKFVYNNGWIFFILKESSFPMYAFFPFCPVSLSLAVDGLFCIHVDYASSLFHLVNWKLLL